MTTSEHADHTPTTEEVREDSACWAVDDSIREQRRQAFDRWLAAHDAEVTAAALASTPSPAQPTEDPGYDLPTMEEWIGSFERFLIRREVCEPESLVAELRAVVAAHGARLAPSPVQGADDRLAQAEAERRVSEGDGLNYDMEIDAFVAGAQWQARQSPQAALNEVRAKGWDEGYDDCLDNEARDSFARKRRANPHRPEEAGSIE